MEIIYKKPGELKAYERNNKIHDLSNVEQIAASIKEFGFNNPVLIDENNVIVAGHGRKEAAELLEFEMIPCIVIDDLTEEQIKAFRIADNKLPENSKWDFEALEKELKELQESDFDLDIIGFDDHEVSRIFGEDNFNIDDYLSEEEKTPQEKVEKTFICEHCGKESRV